MVSASFCPDTPGAHRESVGPGEETASPEAQEGLNLDYLIARSEPEKLPWRMIAAMAVMAAAIAVSIWLACFKQSDEVIVMHRVTEGDSLRGLALYYYKNPRDWHRIYLANRHSLLNEKKLTAGRRLKIPLRKKDLDRILLEKKIASPKGSEF